MFYLEKDSDGRITALHHTPTAAAQEQASVNDPRVAAFLQEHGDADSLSGALASSDTELVRVVEDLISLLVDKKLIQFTELPAVAQQKIVTRQSIRRSLSDKEIMVDDIL